MVALTLKEQPLTETAKEIRVSNVVISSDRGIGVTSLVTDLVTES